MQPSPSNHPPARYLTHLLLILSAITLGLAIQRNEGTYAPDHPFAIIWLTIALLSCLAALFTPARPIDPARHRKLLICLLSLGLVVQFIHLFVGLPGTWKNVDWSTPATEVGPLSRTGIFPWRSIYRERVAERERLQSELHDLTDIRQIHQTRRRIAEITAILNATHFQGAITLLALLCILAIPDWNPRASNANPVPEPTAQGRVRRRIPPPRQLAFPLLLFAHFLLGVWVIRTNPAPHIDVFVFQQESAQALLDGRNPYAITFPNIYGHDRVYAEDLSVNHELQFGFPYPPASLLLILPSYAFTGDHRYAQLLAITLSAFMIACARPGVIARLTAALFLFTPRIFMITECAWTEPLVVLGLSATLFTACRAPRYLPYALGLFFATKQYMLFVPPLAYLLAPRTNRSAVRPSTSDAGRWTLDVGRSMFTSSPFLTLLLKSITITLLISLPLILWNPMAFIHSAVTLQLKQPFRPDALSYLAWMYHHLNPTLAPKLSWLPFAIIPFALALALWKSPRTPSGFALALATLFFLFLAFSKQAFANYYFFLLSALCWALAIADDLPRSREAVPDAQHRSPMKPS